VLDFERGLADAVAPNPWQTDTCVGNWHYQRDVKKYKSPKTVIDMLVDIVSRNGNLLLNFPLPGGGAGVSSNITSALEWKLWRIGKSASASIRRSAMARHASEAPESWCP
jgi:alpha-L-fucosidase